MKYLLVVAHPDDEVLGCGASIYKWTREGDQVDVCIMSAEAKARAAMIIMPPGCSEHNLGLAMDIIATDNNFYKTRAYAWLTEHAQDYGFILRYPKEKQHITKVEYEPWHWRYVGVEHAKKIKEWGFCLEEYLYVIGMKNEIR